MKFRNVHERRVAASPETVAALLSTLGSERDLVWPDAWPRIRFDGELAAGAAGGHGPVRYRVEEVTPSRILFRFTPPEAGFASGLHGTHRFEAEGQMLRHTLEGDARGSMILKWPLIVGPLHDALLEDALDRAAASAGAPAEIRSRHSLWVRFLRRLMRPRRA